MVYGSGTALFSGTRVTTSALTRLWYLLSSSCNQSGMESFTIPVTVSKASSAADQ